LPQLPRPVIAFTIAFILGGVRVDSDLSWPMLALWIAVGAALGFRLPTRQAIVTGLVYGSCLGFASTLYGYRGHLLFIERIAEIFAGVIIGCVCGVIVTAVGSLASAAIVGND
jgi:hypothetical protein